MRATFASWDDHQRGRVAASLVEEVNGLLGLALGPVPDVASDLDRLVDRLAVRVDQALSDPEARYPRAESLALVSALTDDRVRPLHGLLVDLAELLALPRSLRSEYRGSRDLTPPYRVRKLLLEYALYSRPLDTLLGRLTKPFCATACEKLPVGCCHILGYDLGLVPEAMLQAQELEAHRAGWRAPAGDEKCRYHSPTGCVIALFKSPACIGYLCEPLAAHLRTQFDAPAVDPFFKALSVFNNCDLDRKKVFRAMRGTLAAGRGLTQSVSGDSSGAPVRGTTEPSGRT